MLNNNISKLGLGTVQFGKPYGLANNIIKKQTEVNKILNEATLEKPKDIHMLSGGKIGIHTEYLGHLLSDMQYLQRAYPDAKW